MNAKKILFISLYIMQISYCKGSGRYISTLGPLYRQVAPLASPVIAHKEEPTMIPFTDAVDQASGDFFSQASAETTSSRATTFIAMTPQADEGITNKKPLEVVSSGDASTQTFHNLTTEDQGNGVSSFPQYSATMETETTSQIFNQASTWNSALYSTSQHKNGKKAIDLTTNSNFKVSPTNFGAFLSLSHMTPLTTLRTNMQRHETLSTFDTGNTTAVATKQNFSVNTLPQTNFRTLLSRTTTQSHTSYCKEVAELSSQLFAQPFSKTNAHLQQKIDIRFNLYLTSNEYVFRHNQIHNTSDCYLSYEILQSSQSELESIFGIMKYGEPVIIKNHTVHIQLIADFSIGKANKTSLLKTVYLDTVAADLRDKGLSIQNFTIDVEAKNLSILCMSISCDVGTRCEVRESPNERWGECVSSCQDPAYCFNDGICKLNQNGKQTCWCLSSSTWWFRGARCEKMENLIVITVVAGSTMVTIIILIFALVAWMARRMSKSTNQRVPPRETQRRHLNLINNPPAACGHHQTSLNSVTSTSQRVEEEREDASPEGVWNPTFGSDLKMHKILRPIRNHHKLREMVEATSFRSIHSHERAGLNNLHREVQRNASLTSRLPNGSN